MAGFQKATAASTSSSAVTSATIPTWTTSRAIYRNNRDGTFGDVQGGLAEEQRSHAWGDLDGDSDLDLILSGDGVTTYGCTRIVVLSGTLGNRPRQSGSYFVAGPRFVLLTWTAARDLETTNPAALNYSLRAGFFPRRAA
jgi:hypothetical protein